MPRLFIWLLFWGLRLTLAQTDTLGLSNGLLAFNVSHLSLQLVRDSQTAFSLKSNGQGTQNPDFIPFDVMTKRSSNGQYHLGDITFRARKVGTSTWVNGDSARSRAKVLPLPVSSDTLAAADLSPTLPSDSLLNITRRWVNQGGNLQLLFDVRNSQTTPVEIGAIGAPLEFNNVSLSAFWSSLLD